KKLFGEKPSKPLLLDFLNELLIEQEGPIKNITYLNTEHLGSSPLDRRAIFDIYCENEKGEKFIVELQKAKQSYFKDRTLFYATFPIQEQAKQNDWDFKLKAVYTVAILDFVFEEDKSDIHKYRYDVKLTDIETCKVFYDKLTFIYLELPKFKKKIDELSTNFEKWLFVLKNLHKLNKIPDQLKEERFEKLFAIAEVAHFTREELKSYEDSKKFYRDIKNSMDTAFEEGKVEGKVEGKEEEKVERKEEGLKQGELKGLKKGRIEGLKEGKKTMIVEIIQKGVSNNMSVEILTQLTGLNEKEVLDIISTL
ncbi:MAG: Rpn family recombination-promoting nuclease/putative transposase, partial [Haliscomenobacter sp.]|nr:Rpn family recombination-promoting nuclease/putative transposase [Haliscomenobacter sp.]